MMNPTDFLHQNHYKFIEAGGGNFPHSPGFHDIGGVYTSITITTKGILDFPFHINRLYQSCLYLELFKDTSSNKYHFIKEVCKECNKVMKDKPFQDGMIIICCGPLGDKEKVIRQQQQQQQQQHSHTHVVHHHTDQPNPLDNHHNHNHHNPHQNTKNNNHDNIEYKETDSDKSSNAAPVNLPGPPPVTSTVTNSPLPPSSNTSPLSGSHEISHTAIIDISTLWVGKQSLHTLVIDSNYTIDFYEIQRIPAHLKYTRWTIERQPIIDHRPKDIQETLIYYKDYHGHEYLTEGLTSTFYILLNDNTIIMPPTEKILYGSIQRYIQVIAPLLGITILEQPVKIESFPEWKGCFITSSSRLIQPVHKIIFSDNENLSNKYSHIKELYFEYSENHLITKLQEVTFHLIHSCRKTRHQLLRSLSKDQIDLTNKNADIEEMEYHYYEEEFAKRIGYKPWIEPTGTHWNNEFLDEKLPDYITDAMNVIATKL